MQVQRVDSDWGGRNNYVIMSGAARSSVSVSLWSCVCGVVCIFSPNNNWNLKPSKSSQQQRLFQQESHSQPVTPS